MAKIYASKSPEITQREIDNMQLSRKAAGECMVLLENDGALPLKKGSRIALFGSGARQTIRGGTGSGDVNTRSDVNIEQGLENAGFEIVTKDWLDAQDRLYAQAREDYRKWLPEYAREQGVSEFFVMFSYPFQVVAPAPITKKTIEAAPADAAVYIISRTSGEGADRRNGRGDYMLFQEELDQLSLLAEGYDKLVVVLNTGGVMDLGEILSIKGVNALLLMGQLGNLGGDALADVLSGDVNPSGKLVDSWARSYWEYPCSDSFSYLDGDVNEEYYREGIYVGYRYFDSFGVQPLYPFGYGLSYTKFEIMPGICTVNGSRIKISAAVQNTGSYAGREVLQLYCSAPEGKLVKPYQELKAFKKTSLLAPGETETVVFDIDAAQLASYDESFSAWLLEPGDYQFRLGTSSEDTVTAAVVSLDRTAVVSAVKTLFGAEQAPEWELKPFMKAAPAPCSSSECDMPKAQLKAEDIMCENVRYSERSLMTTDKTEVLTINDVISGKCSPEELVAQLRVEEMAALCVGTRHQSNTSIVGSASNMVPGAAGDTSSVILESRGFRNLILADGPAGLRLQPVFKTDKEGNIIPGGGGIGEVKEEFAAGYDETNSDTWYQYCTAIPIGWNLAMSWDPDLLEELGDMIGSEMELFGVDLWLAPAMNIHRNPLCGRNFEYYSEDPLVSGKAAAALTRGVQKHHGRGVTIKHYAANNQENNRYFTNSHISERALREIYLRGFELCVREAAPASIMTSYNLINGLHTANSRDLIDRAARDEWGFDGVVMTDWFTSVHMPYVTGEGMIGNVYPISASTGCIWAGNDLQMPGAAENIEDIIRAVKSGEPVDGFAIGLEDLQFCTLNVIKAVIRAL